MHFGLEYLQSLKVLGNESMFGNGVETGSVRDEHYDDVAVVAQVVEQGEEGRILIVAVLGECLEQLSVVVEGVSMGGQSKDDNLEFFISLLGVLLHSILHSFNQGSGADHVEG